MIAGRECLFSHVGSIITIQCPAPSTADTDSVYVTITGYLPYCSCCICDYRWFCSDHHSDKYEEKQFCSTFTQQQSPKFPS